MATFNYHEDNLVECPLCGNRRIARRHMIQHKINCNAKNKNIVTCRYNASHQVPREELVRHLESCCDRRQVNYETMQPLVTQETNQLMKSESKHNKQDDCNQVTDDWNENGPSFSLFDHYYGSHKECETSEKKPIVGWTTKMKLTKNQKKHMKKKNAKDLQKQEKDKEEIDVKKITSIWDLDD